MTNGKRQTAALIAVSLLLSAALGFVGGRRARPVAETLTRTDTLRFRDTLTVELPVPVLIEVVDTVLVPCVDIVTIRDTVYAPLPVERREYRDSSYRAVVSGFRPSLDLIEVYPATTVVTKTVTRPSGGLWDSRRFGFGVAAGLSVLVAPSGRVGAGLGVTGGVYIRL